MENIASNQEKYENYREQMSRLTKAMKAEFYLEAIFIEYAILEDRLESALRHAGKWNPKKNYSIYKKCTLLLKLTEDKNGLARKYFSEELIQSVLDWKDSRNCLIHALMNQSLHTSDLRELAKNGQQIVKTLNSKTTSFNRALQKEGETNSGRP